MNRRVVVWVLALTTAAHASPESLVHRKRALEHMTARHPEEALEQVELAIKADPKSGDLYFLRAGVRAVLAVATNPETAQRAQLEAAVALVRGVRSDLEMYLTLESVDTRRKRAVLSTLDRLRDRESALLTALDVDDDRIHAATEQSARSRRVLGWMFTGIGIASGATTLTFALLGARTSSQIEAGGLATAGDIQSTADRGRLFNGLALGAGISTAVFGVLGVTLVVTAPSRPPPAKRVLISPSSVGFAVDF